MFLIQGKCHRKKYCEHDYVDMNDIWFLKYILTSV